VRGEETSTGLKNYQGEKKPLEGFKVMKESLEGTPLVPAKGRERKL